MKYDVGLQTISVPIIRNMIIRELAPDSICIFVIPIRKVPTKVAFFHHLPAVPF